MHTPSRLHGDHLGSTSKTTGAASSAQLYEAYGAKRGGAEVDTPYRYTGQRWEENDALDIYYYKARWYDPQLGRFLQPDSIVPEPGNPQSLNRYSYGRNNPMRYMDPTGHWGIDTVKGFVYQYIDDTTCGLGGGFYQAVYGMSVDFAYLYLESESDFQQGREYGRALSEAVATTEIVGGTVTAALGANAGPLTAEIALAAAIPSGGTSLLGGAVVLTAEGVVVVVGTAVAVHGAATVAHIQGNQLPSSRNPIKDDLASLKRGKQSTVRVVDSVEELENLFAKWTEGGTPVEGTTYSGPFIELPDGTTVGMRSYSSSGGPTIDITFPDGSQRKVHIQQ